MKLPAIMLGLSFAVLAATVLLGILLAVAQAARRLLARLWPVRALHALLGAAGLAVLLSGLRGPPRGVTMGAGSFGLVAAWLLGAALAMGLVVFLLQRRRSGATALAIGVHVSFAIAGFVILAAYISMPA